MWLNGEKIVIVLRQQEAGNLGEIWDKGGETHRKGPSEVALCPREREREAEIEGQVKCGSEIYP